MHIELVNGEELYEYCSTLLEQLVIYGPKDADTKITRRSTVQQKLWDLLRLGEVAEQIPYTC